MTKKNDNCGITDGQIRKLLASESLGDRERADCEHALRKRDRYWTRFQRNMQRGARLRCAALRGRLAS